VRDNPSHLTNLHFIDRHESISKEKKILIHREGDEQYNKKVDEQMHSKDAKIADMIIEYLKK
jgi:hypothetical protein